MFGKHVDYLILRALAHKRGLAREADLNRRCESPRIISVDDAVVELRRRMEHFDGNFPISGSLRYLDIGCGPGDITLALNRLGCTDVTGIDMVPRYIAGAQAMARELGVDHEVKFICADVNTWTPPKRYEVLLSFNAFEHIDNPRGFLTRMHDLATPDGLAVLGFGPLFHSPFGDHMSRFFRIPMPWRGVLFSEQAILRVRRECFRPDEAATCFREIVGGLNLMTYSKFLEYVRDTGWQFSYLGLNRRLERIPVVKTLSRVLTKIPGAKDYFTFSVYAILSRTPQK